MNSLGYGCFLHALLDAYLDFSCSSKVHKYGKSTTGESWDIVVDEETYYE
jgi:hypothetical protein